MAEVTQADRDAAADYCQSGSDDGHTFNAMRTGECDNHPLVQAFAAHRLAAEARLRAALQIAIDMLKSAQGDAEISEQVCRMADDHPAEMAARVRKQMILTKLGQIVDAIGEG